MRRQILIVLAVVGLLASASATASSRKEPEGHPAEEFTRVMLERMGAVIEGCPQKLRDHYPDRIVVCAAYPKSFSFFKLEWETTIEQHDLKTRVVPSTPWVQRSGRFVREYEAGDIPVAAIFDDRTGRLAVAFVPPEPEEGEPALPADRVGEEFMEGQKLRVAGFGGVTMPRLIPSSRVEPVHPDRFLIARMDGSVLLSVVILNDGSVQDVRVLRAEPPGWELEAAAVEAVEQWRYEPATLEGAPVDVQHTIRVRFARPNSP